MIVLLGASGYIGQAFQTELIRRGLPFQPLSRRDVDYTDFRVLLEYLRQSKPEFLINAAGFTGRPNVDQCEIAKEETLDGNVLFPQTVAHACAILDLPCGQVSSGCIYSGAKVGAGARIERDLTVPAVRALLDSDPGQIRGFTEDDEPNFSFCRPPCSFYSGSKALAEQALRKVGGCYLWRLRIPFDEFDNDRNYLSKVQRYSKVYDNINSLSHRGDFARACLDLWERRAPFEIYNMTNPGFVSTREVVELIRKTLKPGRDFEFWANDDEFYRTGAKTPRSNCVLDVTKLRRTGVHIRPVTEALEESLRLWKPVNHR